MKRAIGGLLGVVAILLIALAMGPVGVALAEPSTVTIESPADGSVSNNRAPAFVGSTDDPLDEVVLNIYAGTAVHIGDPIQTLTSPLPFTGTWSAGPAEELSDGVYTAQATQTNTLMETGVSEPVTFSVDTRSPTVSLNQPSSPSNDTTPSFSGTATDTTPVVVHIYDSSDAEVSSAEANGTGGHWNSAEASPALLSGTYEAVATQESSLGNLPGKSAPVTFTVETASPRVTLNQPPSPSNDTTPSFTGSASDTTQVTVRIYAGATAKGSPVSTARASGDGAGWTSNNASPALASGQYTAVASQESSVGNEPGTSAPVNFTVETASPTVTLNSPKSPSNVTTPSFTGFASDSTPVTVQIYAGAMAKGSIVSTATATGTGGNWTSEAASPALASGQYTAIAVQQSSLGNPAGVSEPVTFTVETGPPRVTLNQPKSPSNNTTPSFTGTASDSTAVTVEIYSGSTAEGTPVSSATAEAGGSWSSGHASPALSSGQYTAVAIEPSSLGNEAGRSSPVTFVVETASPKVTISQPPSPSNNTKPSFSGTATDSTPVVVHISTGGSEVSSVMATPHGGSWSTSASVSTGKHLYTAEATQESSLGNPPGKSGPVTFEVNTTAPTVTLNSPALRSNNTTPSFSGTASDTPPVTVQIFEGTKAEGKAVSTLGATVAGGAWTSGKATLASGKHVYTVVAKEESSISGNPSGTSSPITFEVNTAAPTVTVSPPPPRSNNTTPSFSGTASDTTPVTVQIYEGTKPEGKAVATLVASVTGGSWTSGKATLASGKHSYTVIATQDSSIGNEPGTSEAFTFAVDTTSPIVTLGQPKSPSNNTTPTFTGTASESTAVTVDIYAGAKAEGTPVSSAPQETKAGEAWTSGLASPALPSGQYTAVAIEPSSIGNEAGRSSPVTFVVETAPPKVTISQPPSPSNNTKPNFSGTATDSTPVVVHISIGGSEVSSMSATPHNGSWSASASLATGKHVYTAEATQESSLGNPPGKSGPVAFEVNTTAPTVTLKSPPTPTNDTTPTFTGTATDTTPVVVSISYKGSVVSTATAEQVASGAWASGGTSPALQKGKHTYIATATQKSSLGNPSGTSEKVVFVVDSGAPTVTLNQPKSLTDDANPSFAGAASDTTPVTVKIYAGGAANPALVPVATATATGTGGVWTSADAGPSLADGQYTAIATQDSLVEQEEHEGVSQSFSFTVDTVPPQLTLASAAATGGESAVIKGTAGVTTGDLPAVTVQLFAGSTIADGQAPLQSIVVSAEAGNWSATFGGLSPGSYVARAEQSDEAGNLGVSGSSGFSISAPGSASAPAQASGSPAAAFSWLPAAPHTGEKISLLSSSTDAASPILGFAWDLAGDGAFAPGGPVNTTSFSTPGKHVVQLRVTDASGLSSVVSEAIPVTAPPLPLMQPFPTVRITATRTGSRVKLKLLSVRASAGARVTVKCTGHGCPIASQSRLAAAGKAGAAPIEFRKFERTLRPGVKLEVRVFKAGEIGKYTRFSVRRGKLPVRADACLGPAGGNPIACPTS